MSLRIFTTLGALAGLGLYTLSLLPDLPVEPADTGAPIAATSNPSPSDIELRLLVYREPGHCEWLVEPPLPATPKVETAIVPTAAGEADSLIPATQNRKPMIQEVSL